MKKEWTHDTKYGHIPFKEVKLLHFKIKGLADRDDTAYVQYQLLTQEPVLRCHIEYSAGEGRVIYNPLDTDQKGVLAMFPKGYEVQPVSEETLPYQKLLEVSYNQTQPSRK